MCFLVYINDIKNYWERPQLAKIIQLHVHVNVFVICLWYPQGFIYHPWYPAGKDDDVSQVKRTKVNPKKEMLSYLEKKGQREAELREEELKLRREEFELQKARFELEKAEREAKLYEDREDKRMMREMMARCLNNTK